MGSSNPRAAGSMEAPPPLMDELVEEILLRVPPSDPATLIRAGLVCKTWRRIVSDPDFLRRYHGSLTPPLLGFLHNTTFSLRAHRFVSLTSPSPFSQPSFAGGDSSPSWRVLDCRHGRVLLLIQTNSQPSAESLVIWDPITGDEQHFAPPPGPYKCAAGAVLRAAAGRCDHVHRGCPSLAVFLSSNECTTWASCVRRSSSEDDDGPATAAMWSHGSGGIFHGILTDWDPLLDGTEHSVLVGDDDLYFTVGTSCYERIILKYGLSDRRLSLKFLPFSLGVDNNMVLMTVEDGELGIACVSVTGPTLELWSRHTAAGVETWTRDRAIELRTVLPPIAFGNYPAPRTKPELRVIAFAEGADTVFISTKNNAGVFTLELKSGRVKEVFESTVPAVVFPYVGFLTSYQIARMN
ncbi:unnamed protein product [Urochloa decumbens]|uniref:F-box domain-containing protein n=1 Tax=Urochloa decumbens TaxID=240449 RepID=A0ABC9GE16_9POAL